MQANAQAVNILISVNGERSLGMALLPSDF